MPRKCLFYDLRLCVAANLHGTIKVTWVAHPSPIAYGAEEAREGQFNPQVREIRNGPGLDDIEFR